MTEEYSRKKTLFLELRKLVLGLDKNLTFQPDFLKTDCSQLASLTKWCQSMVFVSEAELTGLEADLGALQQRRLELIEEIRAEASLCDAKEATVAKASEVF